MLLKCCTQYASKFGKLNSSHRIGKGQFSFQFQRKAMPKNVQTTTKLHSSHMLANNAQNSPSYASAVHELRNFLPRNKCLLISWLQSPSAGSITSWHIDGETMETVRDFIFLGSKITADGDCHL